MQKYKELDPTEPLRTSIPSMQDSIDSVASNFSGSAFPTDNLFVGMHCFRTDLNTEYVCVELNGGVATWRGATNFSLDTGQAETDGDGNSISNTYLKKSDAAATYLRQTVAESTYLKKSEAPNTYYTRAEGSALSSDVASNVQAVKNMQSTIESHGDSISTLNTKVAKNEDALNNLDVSGDILNQNFTVTASTQKTQSMRIAARSTPTNSDGDSGSVGSGYYHYTGADMRTTTGIAAGTYKLKDLIQSLVNKSHTHNMYTYTYHENCNCNCDNTC